MVLCIERFLNKWFMKRMYSLFSSNNQFVINFFQLIIFNFIESALMKFSESMRKLSIIFIKIALRLRCLKIRLRGLRHTLLSLRYCTVRMFYMFFFTFFLLIGLFLVLWTFVSRVSFISFFDFLLKSVFSFCKFVFHFFGIRFSFIIQQIRWWHIRTLQFFSETNTFNLT